MTRGASPPASRRIGQHLFAWMGAAAFCCSLAYFLYFYLWRLGPQPGPAEPARIPGWAVNVGLFGLFGVHHSVMARPWAKRWLARHLPASVERALYVWMASALFFLVCFGWQPTPGIVYSLGSGAQWAGYLVQGVGIGVVGLAARWLDPLDLAGIRQVRFTPGAEWSPVSPGATEVLPDATDLAPRREGARTRAWGRTSSVVRPTARPLTERGPYRLVRHPLYLGWLLLVFGIPIMTLDRLIFAAASAVYLVVAIPLEERSLTAIHGAEYLAYRRRVRWRLVPLVY